MGLGGDVGGREGGGVGLVAQTKEARLGLVLGETNILGIRLHVDCQPDLRQT